MNLHDGRDGHLEQRCVISLILILEGITGLVCTFQPAALGSNHKRPINA